MKISKLVLGGLALVASTASNAATFDFGVFTLNWDETTIFGNPTAIPGAGTMQLLWTNNAPAAVALPLTAVPLPTFSLTVNSGFQLSGPVNVFIGNLAYQDVNGSVTSVSLENGTLDVDGIQSGMPSLGFDKTATQFSFTQAIPLGNFNSFGLAGVLALTASGIEATLIEPTNYSVSFSVAPVPVPGAVWLLSSGLAALTLRRRRTAK